MVTLVMIPHLCSRRQIDVNLLLRHIIADGREVFRIFQTELERLIPHMTVDFQIRFPVQHSIPCGHVFLVADRPDATIRDGMVNFLRLSCKHDEQHHHRGQRDAETPANFLCLCLDLFHCCKFWVMNLFGKNTFFSVCDLRIDCGGCRGE